jgi:hypothetical protein
MGRLIHLSFIALVGSARIERIWATIFASNAVISVMTEIAV